MADPRLPEPPELRLRYARLMKSCPDCGEVTDSPSGGRCADCQKKRDEEDTSEPCDREVGDE